MFLRYAASGTIMRDKKFVTASGVLGLFDAAQDAEEAGLAWARAWIDSHDSAARLKAVQPTSRR
nr:hypothetical protein [Paraburkholderia atlantica]